MFLYFLGFSGNGASVEQARSKYGYSVGMLQNARERVADALYSMMGEMIKWPEADARAAMCTEVEQQHGFRWAFFTVDGTHHNLAFTPGFDREAFFNRKKRYSIVAMVANDVKRRVINVIIGWPGSVHHSRVLGTAAYLKDDGEGFFYSGNQHGLGDAAFGVHKRLIPNYKKPHADLPDNKVYNYRHSKLRIVAEHTIGHIKERFQGVKEVRMKLKRKSDMEKVVKFISSAYILHNMLLGMSDEWSEGESGGSGVQGNHAHDSEQTSDEVGFGYEESALQFRETVKQQVLDFIGYA